MDTFMYKESSCVSIGRATRLFPFWAFNPANSAAARCNSIDHVVVAWHLVSTLHLIALYVLPNTFIHSKLQYRLFITLDLRDIPLCLYSCTIYMVALVQDHAYKIQLTWRKKRGSKCFNEWERVSIGDVLMTTNRLFDSSELLVGKLELKTCTINIGIQLIQDLVLCL